MILTLDGIDFTNQSNIEDNFQIEIGSEGYTISSGVEFREDAAQYLWDKFINCSGIQEIVKVRIFDECVDKWFDFSIDREGISICKEKGCLVASTTLETSTPESLCRKYLEDTIWFRNDFKDEEVPLMQYSVDSGFIGAGLLLLLPIVAPVVLAVFAISNIIALIITALNAVTFGIGNLSFDAPSLNELWCPVINTITGNGQYTPVPTFVQVFSYHAKKCSMRFKSSILEEDPFSRLGFTNIRGGGFNQDQLSTPAGRSLFYEDQAVSWTVAQVLDNIASTYNLEWDIIDAVICMETPEYFENLRPTLLTTTDDEYCISYEADEACSFLRAEYCEDATDSESSKRYGLYSDVIEWNKEGAEWKRGECRVTTQFAMSRFLKDPLTCSRNSLFSFARVIDALREGKMTFNLFTSFAGVTGLGLQYLINFFTDCPTNHYGLIIGQAGVTQCPRLLLMETLTNDAKVVREIYTPTVEINTIFVNTTFTPEGSEDCLIYQNELSFLENVTNGAYQRFWEKNRPENSDRRVLHIDKLIEPFNKDIVCSLLSLDEGYSIDTSEGSGIPDKVLITLRGSTKKIEFIDLALKCK